MAKKILVTGGAGYIGSHTVHMLVEKGHDVLVYDSLEKGHMESLPEGVSQVQHDLAEEDILRYTIKSYKPDAVIHFAGYAEVGESVRNPRKYYRNNLVNGTSLVKAMESNGVNKLIFSSSAAVYGEPKCIPIPESHPLKPTSPYGETKLLFERYLDACKNINSVSLRYFNAAGAGYGIGEDHKPETHLIPLIIQTAMGQRERIEVFGGYYSTPDGTCIRDYVHVLDLAEAHILALDVVEERSEIYNLGTGTGTSVLDVIDHVEKCLGRSVPKKITEPREGDPARLVASYNKIHKDLGWKPQRDIEDIVRSAWEWHSKNPTGF